MEDSADVSVQQIQRSMEQLERRAQLEDVASWRC